MLWLAAAHIASGLLFRSVNRHGRVGGQLDQGSVSAIFKAMAKRARLSPGEVAQISAHSHPESARVRIWCGYGADIAGAMAGYFRSWLPIRGCRQLPTLSRHSRSLLACLRA